MITLKINTMIKGMLQLVSFTHTLAIMFTKELDKTNLLLSSRKNNAQTISNVLYKYVKIIPLVLYVILFNNFCIYMTCIWYDSLIECY